MLSSAVSLWELFKDRAFVIPDYQRSYAWTKRQVEDLWKDLEDNATGSRKHFMGTVILKELEKTGTATPYKAYEIVDGQQRLTSLVMLVAAACRKLLASQQFGGLARRWYEHLVCGLLDKTPDNAKRKLSLGGEDDAYFWQAIASLSPASLSPQTVGQRRLSSASSFFEEKIQNIPEKELVSFLHESLGLPSEQVGATERMLFLVYEVESDLDVGLIFETVNDRGKPLSQLDKIKNYLMYLGSKANSAHLIKAVNNAWGRILRNLAAISEEKEDTEAEENALARYHWIIWTGQPRVYEVHHAVKEAFPLGNPGDVVSDAAIYIDGLVESSELYLKIRLPDTKPGSLSSLLSPQPMTNVSTYFELLNDEALGTMASFAPLIMAALKACANSKPDLFVEIVRLCYLLAWRGHRVCNRRADAGIDRLAKLAHELASGVTPAQEVIDSLKELVNKYGSDREFRENLERNTLSTPERRWFLWRWEVRVAEEQKLAPNIIKWVDARELEIEHIWPQKPEGFDTWPEEWRKKHEEIVDQLGNLVLMQKPWNASMSNKLPYYKRDDYRNSSQASVRQLENDVRFKELCKHREFGPRRTRWALEAAEEFIRERTKKLVGFAFEEWKL